MWFNPRLNLSHCDVPPIPAYDILDTEMLIWTETLNLIKILCDKNIFQYGILIPVICSLLYIFVLSMLFRTSFSDPGVIPRKHFYLPTQIKNKHFA